MINGGRTIVSENEITDNLTHVISVSLDESVVYLKVDLRVNDKQGPFNTEKSFRNNVFGIEDMQLTINALNTEQKVKKYFGIGETNEY